jgi:phytol kinase
MSLPLIFAFVYFIGMFVLSNHLTFKNPETNRILLHILSAASYLWIDYAFEELWIALLIPSLMIAFHIFNHMSSQFPKLLSASKSSRLGFIFLSLAMMILMIFTFQDENLRMIPAVGMLTLGFGDGFASLIGMRYGKHSYQLFKSQKSIEGSLAMFVMSALSVSLYLYLRMGMISVPCILMVSLLATFVEIISPYGLDNLFIPILSALLYTLFFI